MNWFVFVGWAVHVSIILQRKGVKGSNEGYVKGE
jgi:hypothetical protein